MELSSLNRKHEEILHKYVIFIQGTVFTATEEYHSSKFSDFNEILNNIVKYTNAFNKIVKSSNRRSEWAYMTPNLMLYATMGFLSGIKDKSNKDIIDELSEELFEMTVDFIGETTDILEDIQEKELMQKKILTNLNKKNEHNN
mgnify:FL=1|tara:strand:+ start:178 stop:606 length:429 start_codon:yes stop_codon:yes gene_type:complete